MNKPTIVQILNAIRKKNYVINELPFQINIFGIRTNDATADTFNDFVGIVYKDNKGTWMGKIYEATTDPGMYYRLNPMNVEGTAIMIPGQYKDVYKIGLHKGYEAMQQIAPIDYVRDNNKDKVLDFLYKVAGFKKYREIAATNIHHAGADSAVNWNWSAGCQVFKRIKDFLEFMAIIKESVDTYRLPNKFNYTLLEENDFS